ncbi:MAG TPA: hypothetical protein VF883_03675 [Thermoanaerobaculia bacterium]|jgi:hypothetical protein
MALARVPLLCNTRALFAAGLNPADVSPGDFGITTNPTGYLTPQFTIAAQNGAGGWTAQIAITRNAHEGTNDARYLGAGFYSTGVMFIGGGALTGYLPGPNNRQIYVEVSAAIANLNRQAEQEHCDDMVRAYDLTLGAAQTALATAVAGNPYAGATSADAVTAARDAITNGLHARLQAVFNNNIDVNTATVNATFGTALGQLYDDLCALSGTGRDGLGLHTFRPAGSESWSAWSWIEWGARKTLPVTGHNVLFGENKDIRKLVTAPTFQVPGPATNVLITL